MVTSMARTLTRSALTWQAVLCSCASSTVLELFTVVRIYSELSTVTRRPLGYAQQSRGQLGTGTRGHPRISTLYLVGTMVYRYTNTLSYLYTSILVYWYNDFLSANS